MARHIDDAIYSYKIDSRKIEEIIELIIKFFTGEVGSTLMDKRSSHKLEFYKKLTNRDEQRIHIIVNICENGRITTKIHFDNDLHKTRRICSADTFLLNLIKSIKIGLDNLLRYHVDSINNFVLEYFKYRN